MTSIFLKNFPPPSTAIPEPATGGDKSVKQVKAGLTKPSGGHPAMPLISMKARPESGIAKSHAIRSQTDIGALPSAAGLLDALMLREPARPSFSGMPPEIVASPQAADSLDALVPREPARPSFSGMPPEIIEHIGNKANRTAVIALRSTSKKNHAALQGHVDVAIQNIQNAAQYDDVISRIGALDPSLRADRLDALARKSKFSGKVAVRTFFDLADILQGASPDSRGKALRTMVDLIPTLEVKNIPLIGDQERAHDALLTMTQAMSPALQREVLLALIDSRAPDTSRAKAQAALTALG